MTKKNMISLKTEVGEVSLSESTSEADSLTVTRGGGVLHGARSFCIRCSATFCVRNVCLVFC